jgi:hypothetical protein
MQRRTGLMELLADGVGIQAQSRGHFADGQAVTVTEIEHLSQGRGQVAEGPAKRFAALIPRRLRLGHFDDGLFDAVD